jgi:ABC-type tungstate transport system substrate-binding protein
MRDHIERPRPRDHIFDSFMAKTRTRLRTMLHCQYSFGTIVGAPVIFFLGGFIFALLSSLEELGDEDIAEALAFGQWYMIIPHIVSFLLLSLLY